MRAVANIPIHVRSTFTDKIGTIVVDPAEGETVEAPIIAGVAHDPGDAKVTVVGCRTVPAWRPRSSRPSPAPASTST